MSSSSNSNDPLHMRDFCLEDPKYGISLCVASNEWHYCDATLNGKPCKACVYKYPFECDDFFYYDGYEIDCSNVDSHYGVGTRFCGQWNQEAFLPGLSESDRKQIFYTPNNHSYPQFDPSGSSSQPSIDLGDGVVAMTLFILFVMIALIGSFYEIQRQREQRRLQYQRVNQGDPSGVQLIRVPPQDDDDVPVTVAVEAIPDTHLDFEFFHVLPNDGIALKLKDAVTNDDWKSIRDTLSNLKENGKAKNEERSFYFGVISEQVRKTWPEEGTQDNVSFCPFLDAWLEAEPNSSDCRIIRAQVGTSWAWHARSFARLKAASAELKEAHRLSPQDPLVYSNAVPIAKGLKSRETDILQVETCLDALQNSANEPLLFRFHTAALEYYCAKFHGSHQQMFAYARSITSGLPAGHPLWALIPMAHCERNLIEKSRDYWRQAGVIAEIRQAYQHAFPGATETSSQATTSTEKYLEWTSRNYFAFALTMTGLVEEARRQIRVIGRRPTERPWWNVRQYKACANTLGFDVQPAHAVAEDALAEVAQIV